MKFELQLELEPALELELECKLLLELEAYRVSREHLRAETGRGGRIAGMEVLLCENGAYRDYHAHCTVGQVTRYACFAISGQSPNETEERGGGRT